MERREFITSGMASLSTALLGDLWATHAWARAKPLDIPRHDSHRNVLLFVSDDHGVDQLGCYGNPVIRTPHLDAFARQGVRFTNAFAVAASCSASRSAILTGLFPHQNGQYGHEHNWHHFRLLKSVETIPSLLRRRGYRTGLIGKLHVASDRNLEFDMMASARELMGNRDAARMAEYAAEFMQSDRDKPFFLLMGSADPHREDRGPSPLAHVENFSGFANDKNYRNVTPVKYRPGEVFVPDYLPDIREVREELADQYEAVSRLDACVGMVLKALRDSGREQETLVIYVSDNGIPFPGAKTTVYDSGTRIPMIVRSPDARRFGHANSAMVSLLDILPTILDWTGVAPPDYRLSGASFRGILDAGDDPSRTEVFASHTFHEITMFYPMRSVRTKQYRYIHNLFPELEFPFATDLFVSRTWQAILDRKLHTMGKRSVQAYIIRPQEELYDLAVDPAESVNRVHDPQYEAILEQLRASLLRMRQDTADPWLINDHYHRNRTLIDPPR